VRKVLFATALVALGSLGLAGCSVGSASSYGVGYSVGQSLAANVTGYALPHASVVAKCDRQWQLSGSTVDNRLAWVRGCVEGFAQVEAEVSNTSHA
jgi:hypothetical protein